MSFVPDAGFDAVKKAPEGTYVFAIRDLDPISVNEIKTIAKTGRYSRLTLTREARAYLERVGVMLATTYPVEITQLQQADTPDSIYELEIYVVMPRDQVLVGGYWEKGKNGLPKKKAKTAFVRRDLDNILKLLVDGIAKTCGLDDSRFFHLNIWKLWDARLTSTTTVVHLRKLWSAAGGVQLRVGES